MKRFTPEEDQFLKENYLTMTLTELGNALNRHMGSIHGRLPKLGIVVPEEIKQERARTGLKIGWEKGAEFRFKKGMTPHNKGKAMPKHVYEKAKNTMFKKGIVPHNTKFDGAITIRKDKAGKTYKYIRLSKANWVLYHRYVWEQINGPILAGCNIQFKDGNELNCEIENLAMVSKPENMEQNTIHRYPAEVKKALRIISKLEKTIQSYDNKAN